MKNLSILLILTLLTGASIISCSPVNIKSTKFDAAAAASYKTFNFYDVKVQSPDSSNLRKDRVDMLKEAISKEMKKKGLQMADDPDVWINVGVKVENKVQTRETTLRDAPIYIGQRSYHWESEEIPINSYREGTVTIDLIDADSNKMVGQAVASGVIDEKDHDLQKRIDEGMENVFDELWQSSK